MAGRIPPVPFKVFGYALFDDKHLAADVVDEGQVTGQPGDGDVIVSLSRHPSLGLSGHQIERACCSALPV